MIADEASRFITFIYDVDQDLTPEIYIHADAALIIFNVISEPDDDSKPAPTLEQRLRDHWFDEMFGRDDQAKRDQLIAAFSNASRKLAALNVRRCLEAGVECKANPHPSNSFSVWRRPDLTGA